VRREWTLRSDTIAGEGALLEELVVIAVQFSTPTPRSVDPSDVRTFLPMANGSPGRSIRRRLTTTLATALLVLAGDQVLGHYASGTILHSWTYTPSGTYSYFIPVCDSGFDDGAEETRIIDALNEWNEINGELRFSWTNWSDLECNTQIIGGSSLVQIHWGSFSDDTIAQADLWPYDGTSIDDCIITVDSDNNLPTWGSYSWYTGTGGPSTSQLDLESVLVHELGHCAGLNGNGTGDSGHSAHEGTYVMHCRHPTSPDNCTSTNPKGTEKDELLIHDKDFYIVLYGNSH
jgi:hypothetical protein